MEWSTYLGGSASTRSEKGVIGCRLFVSGVEVLKKQKQSFL